MAGEVVEVGNSRSWKRGTTFRAVELQKAPEYFKQCKYGASGADRLAERFRRWPCCGQCACAGWRTKFMRTEPGSMHRAKTWGGSRRMSSHIPALFPLAAAQHVLAVVRRSQPTMRTSTRASSPAPGGEHSNTTTRWWTPVEIVSAEIERGSADGRSSPIKRATPGIAAPLTPLFILTLTPSLFHIFSLLSFSLTTPSDGDNNNKVRAQPFRRTHVLQSV